MKCYTTTDKGVMPGIDLVSGPPYPHVCVGDPNVLYDHRRVEADEALAGNANNGKIMNCSMALDMNEEDHRRASYKLVPPNGSDDDQTLVKFEARVNSARTWYEFPRDTFSLAKGWISKTPRGPSVSAPVELFVLKKDNKAQVYKIEDIAKAPVLVFNVRYDGNELKTA
ncbi:MAG: hypothetical protein HY083_03315 [Gammaproteobacteria bacterium]|nr:hypothetical protein [Gammaproteobacteria bacterium]